MSTEAHFIVEHLRPTEKLEIIRKLSKMTNKEVTSHELIIIHGEITDDLADKVEEYLESAGVIYEDFYNTDDVEEDEESDDEDDQFDC